MTPYLLTASGIRIDLMCPRPEDVILPDLAHALARICRYTGHVRAAHYSVAEHSCHVADHLTDQGSPDVVVRAGLLHDAHEAYTGDVASPIKRALRALSAQPDPGRGHPDTWAGAGSVWDLFERNHAAAVRARFRVQRDLPAPVHAADVAMLLAERRDLMPDEQNDAGAWPEGAPSPIKISDPPWSPARAEAEFLERADRLGVV